MKKVFIVTINFNSENETHDCLVSLKKLHVKEIEMHVVVVDNGSKKRFVLNDKEKKDGVVLLVSEKNLGFTGGSNKGITHGLSHGADFVLVLNNDTIVDENLLTEMLSSFDRNPDAGLIVPKIYFAKGHEYHLDKYKKEELGRVFWFAGGYVDFAHVFNRHRGVDEVDHGQYDKEEKVTFATGCCMLLKREVLESVGMFDDKYYLYFEDGDLSQRILKAGFSLIYSPKAILWHITSASGGGSGSTLHDYYLTRNRMLFGMRFAPIRAKLALLRESMRLVITGRFWQKKGIVDYYLGNFGKGSYTPGTV